VGNSVLLLTIPAVVGLYTDASASKGRPFFISVLIMVLSTIIFFLGTTPAMIVVSRAIQGVSTTFTWVTGLTFLAARVNEGDLGVYVGWTTVGVAVGEIIGPLVGGPIYDNFGHWAAFGVVEALLLIDILLRGFVRQKNYKREGWAEQNTEAAVDQCLETDTLLRGEEAGIPDYAATKNDAEMTGSPRSNAAELARHWLGTVFMLIVIFMVRGALEVVSRRMSSPYSSLPY
jgi:MFS family permease